MSLFLDTIHLIITLFLLSVNISLAQEFKCPNEPGIIYVPMYIPHPDDCTKFIEYIYGEGTELFCGEGQNFDPDKQDCIPAIDIKQYWT